MIYGVACLSLILVIFGFKFIIWEYPDKKVQSSVLLRKFYRTKLSIGVVSFLLFSTVILISLVQLDEKDIDIKSLDGAVALSIDYGYLSYEKDGKVMQINLSSLDNCSFTLGKKIVVNKEVK